MGTQKQVIREAVMLKFAQSLAFMRPVPDLPYVFSGQSLIPHRWGLAFLIIAGLCGCGIQSSNLGTTQLFQNANVKPIREIQKPGLKEQVTVYIQGKIEKRSPFIGQQALLINDTTGKIWVVTNQTNLQVGQQVVLKGTVQYQSIPLGGQDYGEVYLVED